MRKVQQETLSKNNFKSAGGIPPLLEPTKTFILIIYGKNK